MDIDLENFYFEGLNQLPRKSQDMKICTSNSQVAYASEMECVVNVESASTIAVNELSNVISSLLPSETIQCSTKGNNTLDSCII